MAQPPPDYAPSELNLFNTSGTNKFRITELASPGLINNITDATNIDYTTIYQLATTDAAGVGPTGIYSNEIYTNTLNAAGNNMVKVSIGSELTSIRSAISTATTNTTSDRDILIEHITRLETIITQLTAQTFGDLTALPA